MNFGLNLAYQTDRRLSGSSISWTYAKIAFLNTALVQSLAISSYFVWGLTPAGILFLTSLSLLRMQVSTFVLVEDLRYAALVTSAGSTLQPLALATINETLSLDTTLALSVLGVREVLSTGLMLWRLLTLRSSSRPPIRSFRALAARSWRGYLLTVLIAANYRLDILMMEQLGVQSSELGVFAVGVALTEYLWLVPDAFKDVQIKRSGAGATTAAAARAARTAVAVLLPLVVAFAVLGWEAVPRVFGRDYADAYLYALPMLLGSLMMSYTKILGAHLVSLNHIGGYLLIMLCSVALNTLANLALVPWIGPWGAIWASVASYSLAGLGVVRLAARMEGWSLLDTALPKLRDLAGGV